MNTIIKQYFFVIMLALSSFFSLTSTYTQAQLGPIDIVYLWVDGNDPQWLATKERELAIWLTKMDGYTPNRFADNDELRYSLRSILKYAPFINHIYIVTMNQKPTWFVPHPKISIIDHTEIFKDQRNLPTFNSHALESNLHRVPGLSEFFIYFNDDVFLGARIQPSDFFTDEGKIKVLFEKSPSPSGPPIDNETTYRRAWRNTNAYLDARFGVETRYRLCHAPFALRKSFMEEAERDVAFIFEGNSSHKFRTNEDYNIVNGFLQYYWYYHNRMAIGTFTNMMISLRPDVSFNLTQARLNKLKRIKPQTFCLEDVMTGESTRTKELLHAFLNAQYPQPAPWEKIE